VVLVTLVNLKLSAIDRSVYATLRVTERMQTPAKTVCNVLFLVKNLLIYCSPTPHVSWSRVSGRLPARSRVVDHSRELLIEHVTSDDAGKYQCSAINPYNPSLNSRHVISVTVESTSNRALSDTSSLPSVLWCRCLGVLAHPACKSWVMRCWCGYLSGARCRLFAYGPADVTASQNPIVSCLNQIQTGFTFLVLAYAGFSGKEAIKQV